MNGNIFVDVHTHLTHKKFAEDIEAVVNRANEAGLGAIVVNGLDPNSNRRTIALAEEFETILPACGIYPINAAHEVLKSDFPLQVPSFNLEQEIAYIRHLAESGQIVAVGECGLDGYWLDETTHPKQEEVFEKLANIAKDADIPVIVHSRKMEKRAFELLEKWDVKRVNFHCYSGKVKLALQYAAKHRNWCFSIPANAGVNQAFQKMLEQLPSEQILTETDAPYLSPKRGERNEPKNVVATVELMANIRNIDNQLAQKTVWNNFQRLFFKN